MSRKIGAIVLAAGFSNRFGGSKLLATLNNGNKVFQQTLDRIAEAIPAILVVTRPELATALTINSTQVRTVIFEQAKDGMGASLAFASSHIDIEDWDGCLVCLADMPFVKADTYRMISQQLSSNNSIVIPSYNSKPGNPAAFGSSYFPDLANLDGDSGGKSIIKSHPNSVTMLDVNEPGILQDIDTYEDLSRYQ